MDSVNAFFAAVPFTGATWFVLATLAFFVWLFIKADQDKASPVRWEHLIVDSNNDRASPYKVGYLVGLIVGTWIMLTLTDHNKLDFDMFGVYLTYLLGGAGVNSFVKRGERNPLTNYEDDTGVYDDPDSTDIRTRRQRTTANGDSPKCGPSVADTE